MVSGFPGWPGIQKRPIRGLVQVPIHLSSHFFFRMPGEWNPSSASRGELSCRALALVYPPLEESLRSLGNKHVYGRRYKIMGTTLFGQEIEHRE